MRYTGILVVCIEGSGRRRRVRYRGILVVVYEGVVGR